MAAADDLRGHWLSGAGQRLTLGVVKVLLPRFRSVAGFEVIPRIIPYLSDLLRREALAGKFGIGNKNENNDQDNSQDDCQ